MKSIIKSAIFLSIDLGSIFFIFVQYLKSTNYSGGEVGMVPIVILIVSIISFLVSLVLIPGINYFKQINIAESILIYNSTYIIMMIFFGLNPTDRNGFYENIDLVTLFIAIVSMILTLILSVGFKMYYKNIEPH